MRTAMLLKDFHGKKTGGLGQMGTSWFCQFQLII